MKRNTKPRSIVTLCLLFMVSTGSLLAQPFLNPVPIPYRVTGPPINLEVQNNTHVFDPMGTVDSVYWVDSSKNVVRMAGKLNSPVNTYCYNETGKTGMTYLGPTQVWNVGTDQSFNIHNTLMENSDDADDDIPFSTTVHWHGLNVHAQWDGGPHQPFASGTTWKPNFPVIDSVQTIWYHPHLHDYTTYQVAYGLAGIIIVQDTVNDPYYPNLPHNYNQNDFPIVIQEKAFVWDRTANQDSLALVAQMVGDPSKKGKLGNGPWTLINGVVNGVLKVPPQVVRLRFLNGSVRKSFQVGISTDSTAATTGFQTITQIATDGDYTAQPGTGDVYTADSFLISPGERMEFLVDFSSFGNGQRLYLRNLVRSIPQDGRIIGGNGKPGPTIGFGPPGTYGEAFMAFEIDNSITPADPISTMPTKLKPYALLDTSLIHRYRTKRLQKDTAAHAEFPWVINGKGMDMMRLDDTVLVNTMEKWTITNQTPHSHPFHIHKVQFQVIEYTGYAGVDVDSPAQFKTYKYPNLPQYMMGFKDVILVREWSTATYVARFDSFPYDTITPKDGYMYHCHILPHEDDAMMLQFSVVSKEVYDEAFGVDVEEIEEIGPFLLAPNPAGNQLYLKGQLLGKGTLRMFDLLGRTVYTQQLAPFEGVHAIDVGHLPRGMTLVEWTSGETRHVQKIILQ